MATIFLDIGSHTVRAHVDDRFERAGRSLLASVQALHAQGVLLHDGLRVRLGWSVLTLRAQADGALVAHEPDFLGDPLAGERASISLTCAILLRHNQFARRYGCAQEGLSFQDKIVLAKGALEHDTVVMARTAPKPEQLDSGWFISQPDEHAADAGYDAIPAYELLVRRPCLVDALTLPRGHMVVATRAAITTVVDALDRVLTPAAE